MAGSTMKKADVVIVGFGWAGAIMAKELTEAGPERRRARARPMRDTATDGAYPQALDELTYNIRRKLFQDISRETVTIRHGVNDTALPYRQLGAFLPGTGVGGAGLHWSGVHFRVDPVELRLRSHYVERYGKRFLPEGLAIQDFGVRLPGTGAALRLRREGVRNVRHGMDRGRPQRRRGQGRQPVRRRSFARLPAAGAEAHRVGAALRRCSREARLPPV
jgi:choline dehydrogenase-like flavoprotein